MCACGRVRGRIFVCSECVWVCTLHSLLFAPPRAPLHPSACTRAAPWGLSTALPPSSCLHHHQQGMGAAEMGQDPGLPNFLPHWAQTQSQEGTSRCPAPCQSRWQELPCPQNTGGTSWGGAGTGFLSPLLLLLLSPCS